MAWVAPYIITVADEHPSIQEKSQPIVSITQSQGLSAEADPSNNSLLLGSTNFLEDPSTRVVDNFEIVETREERDALRLQVEELKHQIESLEQAKEDVLKVCRHLHQVNKGLRTELQWRDLNLGGQVQVDEYFFFEN